MTKRRGKRMAWVVAVAALVILSGGAILGKDQLIAAWHIRRLYSEDQATRLAAAEKLAAMKSAAAAPHLIELLRRDPREDVRVWIQEGCVIGVLADGSMKWREGYRMTPIAHALWRIGKEALPAIEEVLKSHPRLEMPGGRAGKAAMLAGLDLPASVARDFVILTRIRSALLYPPGFGVERSDYRT